MLSFFSSNWQEDSVELSTIHTFFKNLLDDDIHQHQSFNWNLIGRFISFSSILSNVPQEIGKCVRDIR